MHQKMSYSISEDALQLFRHGFVFEGFCEVVLFVLGILAMLAWPCLLPVVLEEVWLFCPSCVFSRRTCTAFALYGAIDFDMKTKSVKQAHKNKAANLMFLKRKFQQTTCYRLQLL